MWPPSSSNITSSSDTARPRKYRLWQGKVSCPRGWRHATFPYAQHANTAKRQRRPWRQKTVRNRETGHQPTAPGEVVSVDQMISATPGLIAQMSGFLTKDRYTCATVFVDHFSNAGYVHLQRSTAVEHTLEAKRAFEHYARQSGVTIKHYHADNGTFAAKGWVQACADQRQGLSFAATNAHHQNGKAEVRIRHLQEMARSMLLHANKRWPEVISAHLWPYAIRMANESINSTPWLSDEHKRTPNQKFFDTEATENPKHWFHFGCPVYVLDDALQQGHRRPRGGKWAERARVGCYLGTVTHPRTQCWASAQHPDRKGLTTVPYPGGQLVPLGQEIN